MASQSFSRLYGNYIILAVGCGLWGANAVERAVEARAASSKGAKEKISLSVTLEKDHVQWLGSMARRHNLHGESKALRVLLEYAMSQDADEKAIFEVMRCRTSRERPANG